MPKKGLLERLTDGPVVGDGSMSFTLEKRGYCQAGAWTPEAVLLYPDAVRQLLREYARAGADVLTTPCFYGSEGRLKRRNSANLSAAELNDAACRMAREVADEGDLLVCGALSPVHSYASGKGEEATRREFKTQIDVFKKHKVDFVLAEFFQYVEEVEFCIKEMKEANVPICVSMCIGLAGDGKGVSVEECAIRMAKAGADVIGVNCKFDLDTVLKTMEMMKSALAKEGLSPYLMCQPLGFRCPEVENTTTGFLALPENPICMDPRSCTRFEIHKFAREAYELGVNYIGGCCGMEPHHIRAIAQELTPERKKEPPVNDMCPPFAPLLKFSSTSNNTKKGCREYWMDLKPGSGRPYNPPCQQPQESDFLKLDKN